LAGAFIEQTSRRPAYNRGAGSQEWGTILPVPRNAWVCAQMAKEHLDLDLIKMAASPHNGRIFLDYLRNNRIATAVARLCPFARPGATVSISLSGT
jgi:hypothetical protein